MAKPIEEVAQRLRQAKRVVVLSGAGVSAESGIATFRASDGLWEGHRIEDVASPEGFARDPQLVWNFYHARRAAVANVLPNPGHVALTELEKHFGENFTIVTQNVDGLHQTAGSEQVLEIHGSLRQTRCLSCRKVDDIDLSPLAEQPLCADCGGRLRPNIVWFGENLPTLIWETAQNLAASCDVLMVVGTSAVVYPAAMLIPIAQESRAPGAFVVEFNLKHSAASDAVDVSVFGPSGETLPAVVAHWRRLL